MLLLLSAEILFLFLAFNSCILSYCAQLSCWVLIPVLSEPCGLESLDTGCARKLVVATRGLEVGICRSHHGVGVGASTDSSSRTLCSH